MPALLRTLILTTAVAVASAVGVGCGLNPLANIETYTCGDDDDCIDGWVCSASGECVPDERPAPPVDGGTLADAGPGASDAGDVRPDAGPTDAGTFPPDAGSADAGTPAADAGPTDAGAGDTDAGLLDAGLLDAGFDAGVFDAGYDAGPRDCVTSIVVRHAGGAVTDYVVQVRLPSFAGLEMDGANLRIESGTGQALDFWISAASPDGLEAWVRLPSLPNGDTTIYADACTPGLLSASDGDATFPYFFDAAELTDNTWTVICGDYNVGHDVKCALESIPAAYGDVLRGTAQSSCWSDPYDGVTLTASTELPVGAGRWLVEYVRRFDGEYWDYCNGTATPVFDLSVDGAVQEDLSCSLNGCTTCRLGPEEMALGPFEVGGGTLPLSFSLDEGDCVLGVVQLYQLRVRPALLVEPTVLVGG